MRNDIFCQHHLELSPWWDLAWERRVWLAHPSFCLGISPLPLPLSSGISFSDTPSSEVWLHHTMISSNFFSTVVPSISVAMNSAMWGLPALPNFDFWARISRTAWLLEHADQGKCVEIYLYEQIVIHFCKSITGHFSCKAFAVPFPNCWYPL